jgi:excisionase family DNA binding protein
MAKYNKKKWRCLNMRQDTRTVGIKEAARKLNFTLKYVYDLVYLGKLPATKVNRQWRIPLPEVMAVLKKRGGQ